MKTIKQGIKKISRNINIYMLKKMMKGEEKRTNYSRAIEIARELRSSHGIKNEVPRLYLKQAKYCIQPAHVINAAREFENEGDLDGAISAYINNKNMKGETFDTKIGDLELKRGNLEKGIQYYQKHYENKDPWQVIYALKNYSEIDISKKFPNERENKKKELLNKSIEYQREKIQKQQTTSLNLERELNERIKGGEK